MGVLLPWPFWPSGACSEKGEKQNIPLLVPLPDHVLACRKRAKAKSLEAADFRLNLETKAADPEQNEERGRKIHVELATSMPTGLKNLE